MSLFGDIFGGDSAKEAAEKNSARLDDLQRKGMGWLDDAKSGALGSLDQAIAAYAPVTALGNKYNVAGDMLLNALGLNGAAGNEAAVGAFRSSPGYDFKVNQALDALDRRAASRGMLASGNNTLDTLGVVHGLADQDYQNWLTSLSGLTTLGANETNAGAAGTATYSAAKAPIYTNDATSRINLMSGVTSGLNDQETQAANAKMQGASNLMSLGKNLLGSAFSFASGSPNMLGG